MRTLKKKKKRNQTILPTQLEELLLLLKDMYCYSNAALMQAFNLVSYHYVEYLRAEG